MTKVPSTNFKYRLGSTTASMIYEQHVAELEIRQVFSADDFFSFTLKNRKFAGAREGIINSLVPE